SKRGSCSPTDVGQLPVVDSPIAKVAIRGVRNRYPKQLIIGRLSVYCEPYMGTIIVRILIDLYPCEINLCETDIVGNTIIRQSLRLLRDVPTVRIVRYLYCFSGIGVFCEQATSEKTASEQDNNLLHLLQYVMNN